MQEHPIPQDITGYRFHIIGSMTLKQFGEVFVGVIIAGILFKTNLITVIKWPLIVLSVGTGAAAAFLPIEERPLDHWISTFLKVLYKPTKFYWRKVPHIPDLFNYKPSSLNIDEEQTLDLTPAKRQRIKEYVGSINEVRSYSNTYTQEEELRMRSILDSFKDVQVSSTNTTSFKIKKEKPRIDVRVRKMRKPVIQESIVFENTISEQSTSVVFQEVTQNELKPLTKQKNKTILASDQVAQDIQIPEEGIVKTVTKKDHEEKVSGNILPANDISEKSYLEPTTKNKTQTVAPTEALFNTDLPFPIKPTKPNKIVGMILSQNNDLLTNAIVEIQTLEGNIARAVKTNALGQFFVTTPLKSGEYNIIIEKSGYQFQPQHIKIEGKIIQPMEIRSDN